MNRQTVLNDTRLDLHVIEQRVCDIASVQLNMPRDEVQPSSRLVEDLQCDSLEFVELIMKLEDQFLVTIPNEPKNAVGKAIFIRQPMRLSDMAEVVYLQQGTGKPIRKGLRLVEQPDSDYSSIPFSQLGGQWPSASHRPGSSLFEPFESEDEYHRFRRCSDGMRCVLIPSADAKIGSDHADSQPDEQPVHHVQLDPFLIDMEPVSTTAYCRFLNSVEPMERNLRDWFILAEGDNRVAQMPIILASNRWQPVTGTEMLPMVLVSWFGANAYSLWANGSNWQQYASQDGYLPTEAQWEQAALEAFDDSIATSDSSDGAVPHAAQHERGATYEAHTLPMAPVHAPLGLSKFGLHHMAGNVWQWCRDWYADDFYQRPESRSSNPVNRIETGVRSERGGSWVGPLELCRTTYRRGRAPLARGRCLGFRCVSPVELLTSDDQKPFWRKLIT